MLVEILERDVEGLKYFTAIGGLLALLHDVGTARDRAGNRKLFFDHYAVLLLLCFFNPILDAPPATKSARQASLWETPPPFAAIER